MDYDMSDSGICTEVEDYTSSSDDLEFMPDPEPYPRRNEYDPPAPEPFHRGIFYDPPVPIPDPPSPDPEPPSPDPEPPAPVPDPPTPDPEPPERKSLYSLDYITLFERRPETREEEMNAWMNYVRSYAPLMHLMLEEYKFKWDVYQVTRLSRNNPNPQESEGESDNSNGSITSSIAEGYPNSDIPRASGSVMSGESVRAGFYMFLSYLRGGWHYPEVKRYFRYEHGIRCFRSNTIKNALKEPGDFRALIKFRNTKARADVFEKLSNNDMLQYFIFICVDADEYYFTYSVMKDLRHTKGCDGLPRFFVCMQN